VIYKIHQDKISELASGKT